MRLSRKSEYALLALVDLVEHRQDGNVRTADIAERRAIPRKYLEQILLALRHAGVVRSIRGTEGGYRLAKEPGEITLAAVIRLMDGALAPVESASEHFYEPTPVETQAKLMAVFRDIRNYISARMEATTLADIV